MLPEVVFQCNHSFFYYWYLVEHHWTQILKQFSIVQIDWMHSSMLIKVKVVAGQSIIVKEIWLGRLSGILFVISNVKSENSWETLWYFCNIFSFFFMTIHKSQGCRGRRRAFLWFLSTTFICLTGTETLAEWLLQTAHLCT